MPSAVEKRLQDGAPLRGYPPTARADQRQDSLDRSTFGPGCVAALAGRGHHGGQPENMAGRRVELPKRKNVPISRLKLAVSTDTVTYSFQFRPAPRKPQVEARATTLLELSRPARKQPSSRTPAPLPPAPAAARNISTWVGVSAPTPWIIPIPNDVAVP